MEVGVHLDFPGQIMHFAIILMIGWRPINVWLCTTAADDDEAHMVKSLNIAGYHNPRR